MASAIEIYMNEGFSADQAVQHRGENNDIPSFSTRSDTENVVNGGVKGLIEGLELAWRSISVQRAQPVVQQDSA